MGIDWAIIKELSAVLTPIFIFIIGVIIVPLLIKINRRHFLFETKIDCIIHANKSLNGDLKNFSREWGDCYDKEFTRKLGEKKFIDGI